LAPGAFATTLKDRDHKIPLLWQHDPQKPIGRNTGLREDSTGLRFDAQVVTETAAGAEAMALLCPWAPGSAASNCSTAVLALLDADIDRCEPVSVVFALDLDSLPAVDHWADVRRMRRSDCGTMPPHPRRDTTKE
jgi:hypothetical protein